MTVNFYFQQHLIEIFEATKATMMKHNDDRHDFADRESFELFQNHPPFVV